MKKSLFFLSLLSLLLCSCNPSTPSSDFSSIDSYEPSSSEETSIEESSIEESSSEEVSSEEVSSEEESYEESSIEDSSSIESSSEESSSEHITSEESISSSSSSEEEKIYYSAYFYNGRTLLYVDEYVEEGTIAQYKGDIPTKEDDYYKYEFIGWDKELLPLYDDEYYYAEYEEKLIYYSISDLYDWDDELDLPIYYQEEVILEDVTITSVIDDYTFSVQSTHNPLDFYSVDIISETSITDVYTKTDIVTIKGILDVVEGRPTVKASNITWGYGDDQYDSQGRGFVDVYKLDNREMWNEEISRKDSSSMFYSEMMLVNKPIIKENESSSFYVVFPGEDTRLHEDNMYLIEMMIPSVKSSQIDDIYEVFDALEEGEGIYILFQPYYVSGVIKGLMTYTSLTSNTYNVIKQYDNIYQDFTYVNEFLLKEYEDEDFSILNNDSVYNYVIDEYFEKYNYSQTEKQVVSMYTYEYKELLDDLLNHYNSSSEYTSIDMGDDKSWYKTSYSDSYDLYISIFEGFGKVVFETRVRDK